MGLKGMIGKGKRSEAVIEGIRKNKAVYFAAIGGAGALLSRSIKDSEVIAYDDLGTRVAFNAIDTAAAREKGIFVCNNKGCNAVSVAEHTVMLMLMALRCGITGHAAVKAGEQIQFKERFMVSSAPELGEIGRAHV